MNDRFATTEVDEDEFQVRELTEDEILLVSGAMSQPLR
jgi:hypothetical protein